MSWTDLGGIEVRTLVASRFRLDGGAMFGQVPKPLWSRFSKADDQNRIPLVARVLLLRTPAALVLVETGTGRDYDPQSLKRLEIDPEQPGLDERLRSAGVSPGDITHLIVTHLHFDHVGGGGRTLSSGERVPALPGATVWVQKTHWDHARRPGPKEARSFRKGDLEILERMGLHLVAGEQEIVPGIAVRPSDGHTHGLQVVIAAGTRDTLYYPSDLIPTLAHIRAAYTMGYDLWPDRLIQEKEALLGEIADCGGMLVFVHDPGTVACRVGRGASGFTVKRKETL